MRETHLQILKRLPERQGPTESFPGDGAAVEHHFCSLILTSWWRSWRGYATYVWDRGRVWNESNGTLLVSFWCELKIGEGLYHFVTFQVWLTTLVHANGLLNSSAAVFNCCVLESPLSSELCRISSWKQKCEPSIITKIANNHQNTWTAGFLNGQKHIYLKVNDH